MLRGIFFGVFWGAVVAALGLATLSLVSDPPGPSGDAPSSVDIAVPAGSEFNRDRPEAPPVIPGSEETGNTGDTPLVTGSDPEAAPLTDTASAAVPGADAEAPSEPKAPETESGGLVFSLGDEDGGGGSTDTPTIAAPGEDKENVPDAPELPAQTVETDQADEPEQPVAEAETQDTPQIILPGDTSTDAPATEDETPPAEAEPEEDNGIILHLPGDEDEAASTDAPDAPDTTDATDGAATEQAALKPQVRRLPTIGGDQPAGEEQTAEAADADDAPEAEVGDAEPDLTLGALARNALPFTPPDDKPLMAIILVDIGEGGLDRDGLATFPFPVTIAIDPRREDAREAAQHFRGAGLEVLVQAPALAEGTTPAQIGDLIGALVDVVPEAIGLVDAVQGGFGSNRRLIGDAVKALSEGGHGLLTYDRGLNTAQKMATQEGLPAASIFRTLDAEQENPETIKRYLNRAAFHAGQEGHVIMIGHSHTDTVTAIYTWMADTRSQSVTLAPVSAILRQ